MKRILISAHADIYQEIIMIIRLLGLVGVLAANVQAANLPYHDDFEDDVIGSSVPSEPAPESGVFTPSAESFFFPNTSSDWAVTGPGTEFNQRYRNTLTADEPGGGGGMSGPIDISAESSLLFPDLPGTNFVLTYNFTITDLTLAFPHERVFATTGVDFFDPSGDATSFAHRVFYVLDPDADNGRLHMGGPGFGGGAFSTGSIVPTVDEVYTMSITGTYATPGDATSPLTLDVQLTLGAQSIVVSDTTNLTQTGAYISLRNTLGDDSGGGNGSSLTVEFDDFDLVAAMSLITGDLDGDGFVGIADLNIVLSNWNQSVPPANPLADPTGDGFIGIEDLNIVLGNWNTGTPPSVEASSSVPEPGAISILTIGSLMLLRRHIL